MGRKEKTKGKNGKEKRELSWAKQERKNCGCKEGENKKKKPAEENRIRLANEKVVKIEKKVRVNKRFILITNLVNSI